MARTIADIKKSMTDRFMADAVIRERYGFLDGDTFETKFSKVSFENILFFIVAASIYALESLFDQFRAEVDSKISSSVMASIPWYHKKCLEFQYGDELVYDDKTMSYGYAVEDNSKRPVRYASVRDNANGVDILVSCEAYGHPHQLPDNVLIAFKEYFNAIKPAGVLVNVGSYAPDALRIRLKVQYDPMVLSENGVLIRDSSVLPVNEAVRGYVFGIVYGGVFNKTRLVDAVQAAEGVEDVILEEVSVCSTGGSRYEVVKGNNVASKSGSFVISDINNYIRYVREL